jgi:predicted nuclease of predicted toxin-antitoxin system
LFISLYLDEDVSIKIAANLKNRGFDVLHAVEAGMLSSSDEEQLNKAILDQRTFLTHNKKHFRILNEAIAKVLNCHPERSEGSRNSLII